MQSGTAADRVVWPRRGLPCVGEMVWSSIMESSVRRQVMRPKTGHASEDRSSVRRQVMRPKTGHASEDRSCVRRQVKRPKTGQASEDRSCVRRQVKRPKTGQAPEGRVVCSLMLSGTVAGALVSLSGSVADSVADSPFLVTAAVDHPVCPVSPCCVFTLCVQRLGCGCSHSVSPETLGAAPPAQRPRCRAVHLRASLESSSLRRHQAASCAAALRRATSKAASAAASLAEIIVWKKKKRRRKVDAPQKCVVTAGCVYSSKISSSEASAHALARTVYSMVWSMHCLV